MRTVVIDLSATDRTGIGRFMSIVENLASKRRPDARLTPYSIEITTSNGRDRVHVPRDILHHPTSMRTTRATATITRAFARDVAAARPCLSAAALAPHRAADDAAWDRLELLVRCAAPDFAERRVHAHPGTPWAPARCVDGDGRTVLAPAVVEHVFRDAPVILRPYTARVLEPGGIRAVARWDFADTGPLGFEDRPVDPIAAIRAWRDLPDALRDAA